MSTRRDFLGFTAGAVAARTVLPMAAKAAPMPVIAPGNPDAELIRLCAEHVANMRAYNRDGGLEDIDKPDPLWDAYERTRDAITEAKPCTLAGMQAKARAAKAEALTSRTDGTESPEGTPAEAWAWQLVNDLLAVRVGA